MARKKLLDPIHPREILFEEFMKPMGISTRCGRMFEISRIAHPN